MEFISQSVGGIGDRLVDSDRGIIPQTIKQNLPSSSTEGKNGRTRDPLALSIDGSEFKWMEVG